MIIQGGKVFQADATFVEVDLAIDGERIANVQASNDRDVLDASGCYVIPGLTDIHTHGACGVDFSDGTPEALQTMANYELSCGITSFCPTSMTLSEELLTPAFEAAAAHTNECGTTVVGINMEGPFISMEKKGAQNPEYVQKPDLEMFQRLQEKATGLIKLVDLAPEEEGALDFIREVTPAVRVSLAHTTADYECAKSAFEAGVRHVTHLFNAMPPFSHRAPGVIGAAAEDERVTAEMICDGIHVHPSVIRAAFKMFGEDRIILISDSMEAAGLGDGTYALGGQDVYVRGKLATLEDGTIAGSASNLMDCVRTLVLEVGMPLETVVKCATANPCKAIGIDDNYGTLEAGKVADVLVLNENLEIAHIVHNGELVR